MSKHISLRFGCKQCVSKWFQVGYINHICGTSEWSQGFKQCSRCVQRPPCFCKCHETCTTRMADVPNCEQYCRGQCCSHQWARGPGGAGNFAGGSHQNSGSNSISAGPRNPMGPSKGKPKNPRGKPRNPKSQQEGKIETVPFDDLSDLFPITKVEFPDVFAGSNKKGPKNDRVVKRGPDSGVMPGNEVTGEDDSGTDAKMSGLIFPNFGSKDSDKKAGAGQDSRKRSSSELESDFKRDKSYFELEDSMDS